MYLCEEPAACVAEALLAFRGRPFRPAMLRRGGRPLALCRYRLARRAALVDLDDPAMLVALGLRPSAVATRARERTQAQARRLYSERPDAAGLRWWSPVESSWINVTLFQDRAEPLLSAGPLRELGPGDPAVAEAVAVLGLPAGV